ncbi:uncharacterized protein LOC120285254 [Drosophila simulans]|uniref:uncharacterized protein LOC120285254 n=1 Tax=Drosophila simulans TaxID=7240 RepID=UPI00192CEF2C|nr:uncharacterized protein LOC120285254 [Drosophila simulans]XP_044779734.1 uncharacterized protein LOC120285254 [Drosophila simulans]
MHSGYRRSQSGEAPSIRSFISPNRLVRSASDSVVPSRTNFSGIRPVIAADLPPMELSEKLTDTLKSQLSQHQDFLKLSRRIRVNYILQYGSNCGETFLKHGRALIKLQQAVGDLTYLVDQLKLAYEPVSYGKVAVQAQHADKLAQLFENQLTARNDQLEQRLARDTSLPSRPNDSRTRKAEMEEVIKNLRAWRIN